MKTTIGKQKMIDNAMTGLGLYDKAKRKTNLQAFLDAKGKMKGVTLSGSTLKIDITVGFQAEPEHHALIEQIINGHETKVENSTLGLGYTYLLVDLLKPRN